MRRPSIMAAAALKTQHYGSFYLRMGAVGNYTPTTRHKLVINRKCSLSTTSSHFTLPSHKVSCLFLGFVEHKTVFVWVWKLSTCSLLQKSWKSRKFRLSCWADYKCLKRITPTQVHSVCRFILKNSSVNRNQRDWNLSLDGGTHSSIDGLFQYISRNTNYKYSQSIPIKFNDHRIQNHQENANQFRIVIEIEFDISSMNITPIAWNRLC